MKYKVGLITCSASLFALHFLKPVFLMDYRLYPRSLLLYPLVFLIIRLALPVPGIARESVIKFRSNQI